MSAALALAAGLALGHYLPRWIDDARREIRRRVNLAKVGAWEQRQRALGTLPARPDEIPTVRYRPGEETLAGCVAYWARHGFGG